MESSSDAGTDLWGNQEETGSFQLILTLLKKKKMFAAVRRLGFSSDSLETHYFTSEKISLRHMWGERSFWKSISAQLYLLEYKCLSKITELSVHTKRGY